VRTGDKGLGKDGEPKANFEPGSRIQAKVTIFGEGPRGTVSEDLINRMGLRRERQPQVYSLGCKEVIKVAGKDEGGLVLHAMGYPLPPHVFGGGFLYELGGGHWSVGMVASLDWHDPSFDCFAALQDFKKHPLVQKYIRGGEVVAYGAKTIPEGGYFSVPRAYTAGALLAGDSAGLVDVKRLKGIPQAMKSGMLAAEVALEAVAAKDTSSEFLARYGERLENSWVMRDLWQRRNFRSSFRGNLYTGLARMMARELTGGGPKEATAIAPDFKAFGHARGFAPRPEPRGFDPGVIIDKLTAVYKSGTIHREDQPSHIRVLDPKACVEVCIPKHGTPPCTHFCPASVYELVGVADGTSAGAGARIQVNFSNCVHCKTCGILDPVDVASGDHIQNIEWRAPAEGGPVYKGL
jgi:electron-transferring-flavoprotein dehydrogenase